MMVGHQDNQSHFFIFLIALFIFTRLEMLYKSLEGPFAHHVCNSKIIFELIQTNEDVTAC